MQRRVAVAIGFTTTATHPHSTLCYPKIAEFMAQQYPMQCTLRLLLLTIRTDFISVTPCHFYVAQQRLAIGVRVLLWFVLALSQISASETPSWTKRK